MVVPISDLLAIDPSVRDSVSVDEEVGINVKD